MFSIVIQDLVVNLISEDDQIIFPRNGDDLFQQFFAVDCASWVIRVNDHDTTGAWSDFATNIIQVWEPVGFFIAAVVNGVTA